MKSILIAISVLILSLNFINDNPVDRIGVKGPLYFNSTDFKLHWSDKPRENYYIQEYLPEGENLNSYNQMMTIHLFLTNTEVKDAVMQKARELDNRKKSDPLCNYEISQSPDGKEYIIDFLLGESKNENISIAEFNVYHYKQIELSNNTKALAVYAYTKRGYGEAVTDFLVSLKGERSALINEMSETSIPDIQLESQ